MTRCLRPGETPHPVRLALASMTNFRPFETPRECEALWDLATGRTVLEIGTHKGFSAVLMALAGALRVVSVDTHVGDDLVGREHTLSEAWTNVNLHDVTDRVTLLVGRSQDVLPYLRKEAFGLIFVDGDHHQAELDTELAWPLLRRPGYLVWHDREHWKVPQGIARGLKLAGADKLGIVDQLAILYVA